LTKLTSFRALDGTSGTVATGITIPAGVRFHATANFLMIYNGNDLVAISNTGNVIRDDNVANINQNCETAGRGPFTFTLNADGTTTSTTAPAPNVVAQAGGKFLHRLGNDVYLSDSRCGLVNSVLVMGAVNNFAGAKMVEFGGNYYIAIRSTAAGTRLDYYRVTGTTRTTLQAGLALRANNENLYDIDSRGYLYYNVNPAAGRDNDDVSAVAPDGTALGPLDLSSAAAPDNAGRVDGILAFNDRVLARDQGAGRVYDVFVNAVGALARTVNPAGADGTALDRCLGLGGLVGRNAVDVNGRSTAVIRCVSDENNPNPPPAGEQTFLTVFVHNGNGNYSSASVIINNNSLDGTNANAVGRDNVRHGANGVLVVTRNNARVLNPINLCTITTAPTFNVSCSETDLPNPVGNLPIRDTTRIYPTTDLLKFNGNNVFYLSGTSPRVGNIFGTPQSLTTAVTAATGGNATFDLTKFAFSFRPVDAPPGCNTQVAFFSSTTGAPKFYTLSTANTCVARILKVFP
jgi:hypothetical protein